MIALGGAMGSIARYQLGTFIQARVPVGFPWGTFVVNISGCLVMGVVTTLLTDRLVDPNWRFLIPIGFIGAYTTFSTFEYDTHRLLHEGESLKGILYLLGSVVLGLLAVRLGILLAAWK